MYFKLINEKHAKIVACIAIVCALLFTVTILFIPKNVSDDASGTAAYSDTLFNEDEVSDIQISIDDESWASILESPLDETYYSCDITINGETLYNVGIRPKGNTSLTQVASSDSERYSFKVKFDEYVDGQTYNGLDKLNLNNTYSDATYLKEYISYDLFDFMGVTTPETAFSNITINSENRGVYLAVEGLEESYLSRNYGSDSGNLYKAEGTGTDLVWNGDTQSNYSGLKDNSVKDITDEAFQKVIDMISNLNEGTNLEDYIDVEATLKYFAVSTALVNLDSYQCNLYHNYYIYEEDGVCTILPWDLNLSFGAFSGGGGGNNARNNNDGDNATTTTNTTRGIINFPIDEPTSATLEDSPLLSKLLEVDEYKDMYHDYLNTIVEEYFDSGTFESKVNTTSTLIDSYVENNPTAFYGYDQFSASIDELSTFGTYRAKSIAMQLSGEIPSTKAGQSEVDLTTYFSEDSVDMNILGSMGGGNKGGDQGNNTDTGTVAEGQMPAGFPSGDMDQGGANMTPSSDVQQNGSPNTDTTKSERDDNGMQAPDGNNMTRPDGMSKGDTNTSISITSIIIFATSFISIIIALVFSIKFKRKKFKL
ncbi:CotH kinase family protein [Clostridium vincentii]|uniref:Inner spore coat protein H n=1 Tax=Clostridium vincentii TaxID=52704 RepID=A0A2T0BI41_9CLOT|nr:CotH kinase family protein [Clostridium vincentii]PRR83560.1 Inner spore coat protein H [Clostridium vincentii]